MFLHVLTAPRPAAPPPAAACLTPDAAAAALLARLPADPRADQPSAVAAWRTPGGCWAVAPLRRPPAGAASVAVFAAARDDLAAAVLPSLLAALDPASCVVLTRSPLIAAAPA